MGVSSQALDALPPSIANGGTRLTLVGAALAFIIPAALYRLAQAGLPRD
jgi:hypothetical protein